MIPTTKDAYKLLHDGSLALSEIEFSGMKVDEGYLNQALKDTAVESARLQKALKSDKLFKEWEREHGRKTNLKSRTQFASVLRAQGYDIPTSERTDRDVADEEVLIKIDLPFVRDYETWNRLELTRSTFLEGIKREMVDGFVHCSYRLNSAKTHRSSCSNINIQNQIRRNKQMAEIVRRCFISRWKDGVILEVDMSAHEFRVAASVWNDPNMVAYAADPGKDVHRDLAMRIFKCKAEDIKACKGLRDCSKNQVTFPTLYGSWWLKMAGHVWDFIDRHGLTVRGMPAKEWLASKGVAELGHQNSKERPVRGTFEYVMSETEKWFNESFPVFSAGKKTRWEEVLKRGWFDYVTGFRIHGHCSKNFFLNSIVQGPAFHVVLWSLIVTNNRLAKGGFKSKNIAEVHDSVIVDAKEKELPDMLPMYREVMTQKVRRHWPWITAPLDVEAKVGPNWYQIEGVKI